MNVIPRFNFPSSSAVDALVQDWSDENNWICPPENLIIDSVVIFSHVLVV